jgi:hypothetical protein
MHHVSNELEMRARFWCENLTERHNLEILDVDGSC